MNTELMFSSMSDEWSTPEYLMLKLCREFGEFDLDPCATAANTKAINFFTKSENGLSQDWSHARLVFMNPPYGRKIGNWIKKAYDESLKGCFVVCLLPSRTDTQWFHDYCKLGEIRFIRGRLKFGGAESSAPFPSMIVIFRPLPDWLK